MSVEGGDIKKSSIRRMSCRDERRRHVRRLAHGFVVWLGSFDDGIVVFYLELIRVSDNQFDMDPYVVVAKGWVDEVVRLILFVMWLRLLWIRGLGITLMGVSEAEYLTSFETHPNMGISSMAFVGFKSKCDVLMLIQTILSSAQSTQPKPARPFQSPTAPGPLTSGAEAISFPSPPLGSSLLRTSLLMYPSVSNRCEFPCMTGSLTLSVRPCPIITPS